MKKVKVEEINLEQLKVLYIESCVQNGFSIVDPVLHMEWPSKSEMLKMVNKYSDLFEYKFLTNTPTPCKNFQ